MPDRARRACTTDADVRRGRGERGQVVPLMIGVIVVAAMVLLALVPLGQAAGDRTRARNAADAAALAGAAEGEDAAREVAADNDAVLVGWHEAGTDVWVEVTLGDARARARARREPVPHP